MHAIAIGTIDVLFAERRIIDVTGQPLVIAAHAKCGAITDRQVDHGLNRPTRVTVCNIPAASLDSSGKLRRVGRISHVLEKTALTAGAVQGSLGPAQHLHTLQVPGVEITAEKEAVGKRVARAEGR